MPFHEGTKIRLGNYTNRDFPVGTTLTVTSRRAPEHNRDGLAFGCQTFTWAELREADAIIDMSGAAPVVTATATRETDYWNVGGHRVSHNELVDYAQGEVTVKAAAPTGTHVMLQNGVFGCSTASHGDHIFVASSLPNGGPSKVARLRVRDGHGEAPGNGRGFANWPDCRPVQGATFALLFTGTTHRNARRAVQVTADQFPGMARVPAP